MAKKRFMPGRIQIQLQEDERKWLLSWVKSIKQTEKDTFKTTGDPLYKQYLFFAEKFEHVLMTGTIQGTKYSRQKQTSRCPVCKRDLVYLHRHACKGLEIDSNEAIDWEAVARI